MNDVIVVGGGLAGLFNAILLNRAGLRVTVIEKKSYPMHRVCGEYISNEVIPFLNKLDIDLEPLQVARINRLEVTAVSGTKLSQKLDLGGFGLSRFTFDHLLYQKAVAEGVSVLTSTRVEDIRFVDNHFEVTTPDGILTAPLVIGSFGKRSNLDQKLKRPFFYKRSPFLAVKFHLKMDFPDDLIQLNNYKDGYCGVSKTDGDRYCMCYMAHRDDLRKYGTLQALEENVIRKNQYLDDIFRNAEFLLDKPEVINEISFEKKSPVEDHILMSGDTAGMIAPLCGNGMTMAIHSAKILSEKIINHYRSDKFTPDNRAALEADYSQSWNNQFARRLWTGRQLQRLFGNNTTTALTLNALKVMPPVSRFLISKTHGKPFAG
ncbi:NAD(P)/FAD-dependent oxidoreductase [Mucilaginibacter sabulilitoris]|uniref:NAD(P)/FAD-dependent oxidoreductase n=1 Tax=Mucilaginibacter sabulilitoris TaxID=1173583 RepID=A0ABZ0TLZ5_9SPHI|nr:NAD(P)/FAD-dependent oxidoreductase [Mucilaginibacter sabulilitoris]WPU93957.1 NAD(P)/FAD-dependent oxidoreductase [Mucilaginibacter sabulilitoris]